MSDEVCFGYLVSYRDLPIEGLDNVVGPLISMLIQKVTIASSSTLLELTKVSPARYSHQHATSPRLPC